MKPKSFTILFVFVFLLNLIIVTILNFVVNPTGAYDTTFFPTKIETSRKGKTQKLINDNICYDVLLLGSSRTGVLNSDYITTKYNLTAKNFSFTCTGTEDYYCQAKLLVEKKQLTPKYLVIGLDFFNFRPRPPQVGLKNTDELYKYINQTNKFQQLNNLISIEVTKLSLGVLVNPPKNIVVKDSNSNVGISKFQYSEKRVLDKIDRMFTRTYSSYTALSSEKMDYFEKTLKLCKDNGIKVVVFLTPFHPKHYNALNNHVVFSKTFKEFRDYSRVTTIEYNAIFFDFSDITACGIDSYKFSDSVHFTSSEGNKIIDLIFEYICNNSLNN